MKRAIVVGYLVVLLFGCNLSFGQDAPPYTDYCEMLARNIQGKKTGFMAGNKMLYLGGQAGSEWQIRENETLGFTHGYFYDGRCRGRGIYTTEKTGTGHDFSGWEFYRETKIAEGTVIVDGQRFPNPVPQEMIWRPDGLICRYEVAGVDIEERKFVSLNDVFCSVIKSSGPVELEFTGQSFVCGDSVKRTAEASFDSANNAIHVIEGGTVRCEPEQGMVVEGKLMYDGMHTVLSASSDIGSSQKIHKDNDGRQVYVFSVPCDSSGVSIFYSMGDDYGETVSRIRSVLADPKVALHAKTDFMNDLLNQQVPYFRCSSEESTVTYYYLWALYFMYFRDVGEGYTKYPYTVTAVNNFQSAFAFDHWAYTNMASWITDKDKWGNGNALIWTSMLPYAGTEPGGSVPLNSVPETIGTTWRSPLNAQNTMGHVEGVWKSYRRSGDRAFLKKMYDFYSKLYWKDISLEHGIGINVAETLAKMAETLGKTEDIAHWQEIRSKKAVEFNSYWEAAIPDFFGTSAFPKDVWNLACFWCDSMPDEWVRRMTGRWVMNAKEGYWGEVPLSIRAKDSQQIRPFCVNTINTWITADGMFKHHVDGPAIKTVLGHIHGMNKDYGFPVTPEAWDQNYKPWGDMYYGWDEPIILPLVEDIAGVDFSVIDKTFTVCDHLPMEWEYVETRVPIKKAGEENVQWASVRIDRCQDGSRVLKTVTVSGIRGYDLLMQPWSEEKSLTFASPGYFVEAPRGHIAYSFKNSDTITIALVLEGTP
jgi:hypothetical protein